MTGVAASLASAGRQTGTTLGVAITGTIVGASAACGGSAFTSVAHDVWWTALGLGLAFLALAVLSTRRWAGHCAARAAVLFADVDAGPAPDRGSARVVRS